jgi:hypothetical protein
MLSPAPRWVQPIAYTAFVLGAVLLSLQLVQLLTTIRWLDDPWTGAVGLWLLAFVLYGWVNRSDAPS